MSRERNDSESSDRHDYLVKLRGIPHSATKEEIRKFLHPCAIVTVHLFNNDENTPAECLVDLESDTDVADALKNSGQYLDDKPVEVSTATIHEFNFYMKKKGNVSWTDSVLRMSGLPFACTMANVQNFFEGIEIARNGIYITRDMADKALGEGFVAFINMENAFKAIDLHDQKYLQHRYIELFPSSYEEAKRVILDDARSNARQFAGEKDENEEKEADVEKITDVKTSNHRSRSRTRSRSRHRSRSNSRDRRQREVKRRRSPLPSPPSRSRAPRRRSNQRSYDNHRRRSRSRSPIRRSPGSSSRSEEFQIKMRGMPYTVVEEDIRKFFPSSCQPKKVEILQDRRMHRPNGDAYVFFNTAEDVIEAMKCDRKYMGSRYIELYHDSPRPSGSNQRPRRSNPSPRRSSPSPPKSRSSNHRRSRSDSDG